MTKDYEAVLVPGGGVTATGTVVPWVQARLDRAIALAPPSTYLIPLSAGTPHKPPPLDAEGFPMLESVAAARYLVANGVEPQRILPETVSLDTIGNAYFARVQHTDPLELRRLHVITSAFHLPRTQVIFDWIFGLPQPGAPYQLTYEAVADVGIDEAALTARRQREAMGRQQVLALRSRLTTLPEVHCWLYTDHEAYAIGRRPTRAQGKTLQTY